MTTEYCRMKGNTVADGHTEGLTDWLDIRLGTIEWTD